MLLLGGSLGTTLDMWEPQVPALSRTHRVIRFDHRGHGGSPVPTGPYTIDELGGDVLTCSTASTSRGSSYCGLSIGGMVGMWLAINAPERIDRLVLLLHLGPPAAGFGLARARRDRARGGHARGGRRRRPGPLVHPGLRWIASRGRGAISGHDRLDRPRGLRRAAARPSLRMDLRDGLPGISARRRW